MKVVKKRIKRMGRYYVYYFVEQDGKKRLATVTRWSSSKSKREVLEQLARERIKRKFGSEDWKEAYLVKAHYVAVMAQEDGESYGGYTGRMKAKAKIKMEDGEVVEWEYLEDTSIRTAFLDAMTEFFTNLISTIGMVPSSGQTNFDVVSSRQGWDVAGDLALGKRIYMVEAVQRGDHIVITSHNLGKYKLNQLIKVAKRYGVKVLIDTKKKKKEGRK